MKEKITTEKKIKRKITIGKKITYSEFLQNAFLFGTQCLFRQMFDFALLFSVVKTKKEFPALYSKKEHLPSFILIINRSISSLRCHIQPFVRKLFLEIVQNRLCIWNSTFWDEFPLSPRNLPFE